MKTMFKDFPRNFSVGKKNDITIKDLGTIELKSNEQITFITPESKEYDLCRKNWGYYATPSVNDRLKRFGFKTALVKNSKGQVYVMLVESDKIELFEAYLKDEENFLIEWLDERPLSKL